MGQSTMLNGVLKVQNSVLYMAVSFHFRNLFYGKIYCKLFKSYNERFYHGVIPLMMQME